MRKTNKMLVIMLVNLLICETMVFFIYWLGNGTFERSPALASTFVMGLLFTLPTSVITFNME